ncbi:TRAFAC clade GTPase domain-containing protein [Gimesia panareensis]|uniref:TRAFAC clade GTPase domain-containing protein n=1 Tax=Gimesia panareensis TaxID=2527978 RepID=UPI0011895F9E|nr:hypothetical protein [Gimesia panareensis]QDU52998.1 hypothetical protein Pan110_53800 [Gimesia panareensis]
MSKELEETQEVDIDDGVEAEDDSLIDFYSGDALSVEESRSISMSSRVQLILLAGAVDCGKSSLIASLFHCFQNGPLGGYLFAGSRTLVGFERRCHKARVASNRDTPTMDRTSFGEKRKLLHLKVAQKTNPSTPKHLFFADVSGESFEDAINSVDDCAQVPLLRRSDHFVLLVDGSKMIDLAFRQNAKKEALLLLQSCIESNRLGERSLVDVIFSKYDLFVHDDTALNFIESIKSAIKDRFGDLLGRIRFSNIAAIPETGTKAIKLGYGLNEIFPSWVEDNPGSYFPIELNNENLEGCCEFDYFGRNYARRESGINE